MLEPMPYEPEPNPALEAIIWHFLCDEEDGLSPSLDTYCDRHPGLAEELREWVTEYREMEAAVAALDPADLPTDAGKKGLERTLFLLRSGLL